MKIPRIDLLSDESKRQRKLLLISCFIAFGIIKIGLVPTKIAALGIEFSSSNMKAVPLVLAILIVYFLTSFIIYIFSDLINLNKESLKAKDSYQREFIGDLFSTLKEYSNTEYSDDAHKKSTWLDFSNYVVTELRRPFTQSFGPKIIDDLISNYVSDTLKRTENSSERARLESVLNRMAEIIKIEAGQQCFHPKYEELQQTEEERVYNIRFYFDVVLPIVASVATLIILFIE